MYTFLTATAITIFMWHYNETTKYYTKFILFGLFAILLSVVFIPFMIFRPLDPRNGIPVARCTYLLGKYVFGMNIVVKGKENIIQGSGVVLLNQQSLIDFFALGALVPLMGNCAILSKKEYFKLWPFGLAAWLAGTIFIDRLNIDNAVHTLNATRDYVTANKIKVIIFAEGTRNQTDALLPFKKGSFHLAVQSKCPIQPVIVSKYHFLGDKKFNEGNVEIQILPAIDTCSYDASSIHLLIDKTYHLMQNQFKQTLHK